MLYFLTNNFVYVIFALVLAIAGLAAWMTFINKEKYTGGPITAAHRKLIFLFKALIASLVVGVGIIVFSGGHTGVPTKSAKIDVTDRASLQHGAAVFRDYCLSCHGLSLVRYNQLTKLGISEDDIKAKMMTTTDKIGDTMQVAMNPADAKRWLGVAPPDLSLMANAKGADYIYSYLTGFYKDDTRETGWNNLYLANVAMPHVLWQEEGIKTAKFVEVEQHGTKVKEFEGFEMIQPGKQDAEAYDKTARDLTNFLVWAAEPDQTQRKNIGFAILAFLLLLAFVANKLSKNYWKDIH
ncbi:cytochrome c1 [Hydromonas duriensis]|uniref:Ubiquinol-cytochrome c reductase cytochrome c1 subunit n=1 Tax=Hydromonas duriensis TaxID=1527608 RepID=A0A4R6YBR5_9BURK|nr:cytochrome c1 [Hydromonas duriensis]TDR33041.1 ubiquinol-cytochrome c reductase cytochrome c1 subunit [Hydromonas duriensis]